MQIVAGSSPGFTDLCWFSYKCLVLIMVYDIWYFIDESWSRFHCRCFHGRLHTRFPTVLRGVGCALSSADHSTSTSCSASDATPDYAASLSSHSTRFPQGHGRFMVHFVGFLMLCLANRFWISNCCNHFRQFHVRFFSPKLLQLLCQCFLCRFDEAEASGNVIGANHTLTL